MASLARPKRSNHRRSRRNMRVYLAKYVRRLVAERREQARRHIRR